MQKLPAQSNISNKFLFSADSYGNAKGLIQTAAVLWHSSANQSILIRYMEVPQDAWKHTISYTKTQKTRGKKFVVRSVSGV